jgi:hypothetical protein
VYTFTYFSSDDGIAPSVFYLTSSVNDVSKDNLGYLNFWFLTSDPIHEPYISFPPFTIVFVDSYISTNMDSCDSLQQDLYYLPATYTSNGYLIDIPGLFFESHISYLGNTIDFIHLIFDEDYSSLVVVRE